MRDKMGFWPSMIYFWIIVIVLCGQGYTDNGSDDTNEFPFDGNYQIRPDTKIVLRIPYENTLYGEIPHIYVAILNIADNPLRLVDFTSNGWEQMLFLAREKYEGPNLTRPESIPRWDTIESRPFPFYDLNGNSYRIYKMQTTDILYNYDILPKGTSQIRIGILTGPDEWVFSNWARIQRLSDRKLDDCTLLTSVNYSVGLDLPIRKALIDNDKYLFIGRMRICRLPEGATPRFDWDKEKSMLTVHFDGVDIPPLVYYARMYDYIEWTAEVAPHQEVLAALKREMEQELQSIRLIEQADDATSAPVPSASSLREGSETLTERDYSHSTPLSDAPWIIMILAAGGVAILAFWVVFTHR